MKNFSSKPRLLLLALIAASCAAALLPAGAGAEANFTYQIEHERYYSYSYAYVYRLDPSKTTTMRVMRGAVELERNDYGSGNTHGNSYVAAGIQAGDVVEVYQPQTANPVPNSAPTETWTVPELTGSLAAGSPVVTGSSGTASTVRVRAYMPCQEGSESATFASVAGGSYTATLAVPPVVGSYYTIVGVEPDNDSVEVNDRVPGDAFCVSIDGAARQYEPYPNDEPFGIYSWGYDQKLIPTTRIVLRRGATVIADNNATGIDLKADQQPLPGDVVEVYRPQGAPTPAFTVTVPAASAVFDPGNDLVAVQAPAAAANITAEACTVFDCSNESERVSGPVPAGRTFLSFVQPSGWSQAFDLQPDSQVSAEWVSTDYSMSFDFPAVPGDLTSPIGKITLAKKLKLKKIGKRIKFKLNSSEAGTLSAKLTTATPKRRGKSKKPVTLASAKTRAAKAGTNTVSLTVSKGGKKAIKKLISYKKAQTATLTITLTDGSGNVTTVVKSTKLALR